VPKKRRAASAVRRGSNYTILFVDPKGMSHADYQHKIDGYRELFEDGNGSSREISHQGLTARVALRMYTADANRAAQGYRAYWYDRPEQLLEGV
jgi:hypothetical protein